MKRILDREIWIGINRALVKIMGGRIVRNGILILMKGLSRVLVRFLSRQTYHQKFRRLFLIFLFLRQSRVRQAVFKIKVN